MPEISIAAEKIFSIGSFPVTNTLLMSWLVLVALSGTAIFFLQKPRLIPGGLQNIFEVLVEWVLGLMDNVFGDREKSAKYFPIIATIFLFILFSNWFGIFPILGSIGIHEEYHGREIFVPLFRSSASDLNFTLALAIIAVVMLQVLGVAALGAKKYAGKFFTLKSPVDSAVGILEIVSEFAKMISFSFRLFGNVFAGEVLLIIVGFLVPYLVPVPFLMLEIFVGFVQALVFAILTTVFISIATTEHGEEHAH